MGYGVAMSKKSYRHMSAEDREPGPGPVAADDGQDVGARPQHREPRVGPQHHAGPSLSCLHGAHPGIGSGPSAAAATETRGPLVVAVRADASG